MQYLGKEYLNYLVTGYFFILGTAAIASSIRYCAKTIVWALSLRTWLAVSLR
jgi:hypothetical protein